MKSLILDWPLGGCPGKEGHQGTWSSESEVRCKDQVWVWIWVSLACSLVIIKYPGGLHIASSRLFRLLPRGKGQSEY